MGEIRKKGSFLERILRPLVLSLPISLTAAIIVYTGLGYGSYRIASNIADKNRDGIVAEEEWRETYNKASINYEPVELGVFPIQKNIDIIKAYCKGRL